MNIKLKLISFIQIDNYEGATSSLLFKGLTLLIIWYPSSLKCSSHNYCFPHFSNLYYRISWYQFIKSTRLQLIHNTHTEFTLSLFQQSESQLHSLIILFHKINYFSPPFFKPFQSQYFIIITFNNMETTPKTRKRCYYQVLNISETATAAQIKSSYKKLALQLHPDKSPDPDAKEKFVEVQEAYKILSDVNERTWYDNHKEQILFNKHQMTEEEFDMQTFGFDLNEYLNRECYKQFSDEAGDFYAVYRKVFQLIKQEQRKAYDRSQAHQQDDQKSNKAEFRKYPGFGDSSIQMEDLKRFYNEWESFSSFKNFCWADEHNLKQAENRYVRRQMQKENKAQRARERKRYITAIKDLVSFVKKRDPRVQKLNEYLVQEQKRAQELKKKKIQEDRLRRERLQQQKKKEMQETRLRMEAMKSQEQKQRQRQQFIQKPKIQEKREKLVKHQCATCLQIFKDFNKHFQHIQKTGHAKAQK